MIGYGMKVINPTVSIVLASHMKPEYLPDALDSILDQTRLDIEVILIDSGEWIPQQTDKRSQAMQAIYDVYSTHPLINWYTLGETPHLIDRKCPYAYIWNLAIRELIRGKYICFFTDDDLYSPEYVEQMAGYLDVNPDHPAVFCAESWIRIEADGTTTDVRTIPADAPRSTFDNEVDMLQMMVRKDKVLDWMSDPWFNEDSSDASCRHADGQFMDRVGHRFGEVPNLPLSLVTHRFTPISTYN